MGDLIALLRKLGYSEREIARRSGIPRSTIRRLPHMRIFKARPHLNKLYRLIDDELIGEIRATRVPWVERDINKLKDLMK